MNLRFLVFSVFVCFGTLVSCFPLTNDRPTNNVIRMLQQSTNFEESKSNSNDILNDDAIVLPKVFECAGCSAAVTVIRRWLREGESPDTIGSRISSGCSKLHVETKEVCHGIVEMFKEEFFNIARNVTLTSHEVCEIMLQKNCSGHIIPSMQWSLDIPPRKSHELPIEPIISNSSRTPLRVLHLTDIHIDSSYLVGSDVECNEPLCCRKKNGLWRFHKKIAGKWGSPGKCDLPKLTVEDILKRLSLEKFDYVLWTGDLISHDVWNQSKEEQLKVLDYITEQFLKFFPNTPIFPALGNHEGVPANSFPSVNFSGNSSVSWLYEASFKAWSHWLPEDSKSSIMRGGFYTTLVAPKQRIVSLNSNFCNNMNWWLMLNSTDPASQLQWLVSILQQAEEIGEKVHIIGHIPPGIPDCLQAWSWNYYRIVNRFNSTITGQFFGHMHYDSFQMFYDIGDHHRQPRDVQEETLTVDRLGGPTSRPISVAYLAPSLTSFHDLNPGYRVYDIDADNYSVLDHHTFIMDLSTSNKLGKPVWLHEYSAKEAYGMDSLAPDSWQKVINQMKNNASLFNQYYKNYFKQQLTSGSHCNAKCQKTMLCLVVTGRSYDDSFCRDLYRSSSNDATDDLDLLGWYVAHKQC